MRHKNTMMDYIWWVFSHPFTRHFEVHQDGFLIQCRCCKWSDENAWTFLFKRGRFEKNEQDVTFLSVFGNAIIYTIMYQWISKFQSVRQTQDDGFLDDLWRPQTTKTHEIAPWARMEETSWISPSLGYNWDNNFIWYWDIVSWDTIGYTNNSYINKLKSGCVFLSTSFHTCISRLQLQKGRRIKRGDSKLRLRIFCMIFQIYYGEGHHGAQREVGT